MGKKKDDQIQIRINKSDKAKLKYLAEVRGYKNLSEYILYLAMKDISESEFINSRMKKDWFTGGCKDAIWRKKGANKGIYK